MESDWQGWLALLVDAGVMWEDCMHRRFLEALEAEAVPPYTVVFLGDGERFFLGYSLEQPGSPDEDPTWEDAGMRDHH